MLHHRLAKALAAAGKGPNFYKIRDMATNSQKLGIFSETDIFSFTVCNTKIYKIYLTELNLIKRSLIDLFISESCSINSSSLKSE